MRLTRFLSCIALAAAAFVAMLVIAVTPVFAAECEPREKVEIALSDQFGEVALVQGLSEDGRLMEIWSNPATGTWTATMTRPDGLTCLSAGGDHFQEAPALRPPKPGDPA